MKLGLGLVIISLLVVGAACSKKATKTTNTATTTNTTTTGSTTSVTISGRAFSPATMTVAKGTTVTWTNQDSLPHTVTGDNGGPSSGQLSQGQTYPFTFDTAGTFDYHCANHSDMLGKVIVTQ